MSGEFIAGPYSSTWNAGSLGQTQQGYTVYHSFHKRPVTGDKWGDTVQNAIYRGRDQGVDFECIEARLAGVLALLEMYGTALDVGSAIGALDVTVGAHTGKSKSLVLTAISGSSAATFGPATATFPRSAIMEGHQLRQLFGPDLRNIPFRLRCYPDANGLFGTLGAP